MFRMGVGGGHGFFVHDFLAPTGLTDYAVTCFSQIRSSTKCSKRDIVWSEGNGRQMKMKQASHRNSHDGLLFRIRVWRDAGREG